MKKIISLSLIFLVLLFPNVTNASDEYIQTSTKVLTELLDRTFDEFKNPVSLNTDDLVVKNKDSEMYLAHMDFNLNYLKLTTDGGEGKYASIRLFYRKSLHF